MNNADYIRELRPLLPAEAFRPNPWAYVPISIHVAIIVTGWFATWYVPHVLWPAVGLVIGSSAAAICLYAHEVSHRSVTTNKNLLYPTEVLLWGLVPRPATLRLRVHGAHDAHTNGEENTDRRLRAHVLTPVVLVAAALMFPNRVLLYSFTVFLYVSLCPWRHTIAMLWPGKSKPAFVT